MIVLCFDYGIKKIGLAIAETQLNYSTPIRSIFNDKKKYFWKKIYLTINEWNPECIIIGYPYNINKKINKKIRKFSFQIKKKFKKPIFLYNENYSSKEAQSFYTKKSSYCIHSVSAKIILDGWLQTNYMKNIQ
ncbi:Holliday junction resolvase RuvX [Buchnera aphidicola]|uniref:Putative pre-16S rRNA nuclease n=1 Tax=Buchnera aphidicola (Cinara strobi) TaxID=1921549 RepID=A0A3B1DX34_9GAMM|nr:Holliday junction resolvase RuvX [Buchnera aphidicola]VAX76863.1 Putative pre-16S rRNA nuclease [Buchnera aphidicola (Cinara strobi)]